MFGAGGAVGIPLPRFVARRARRRRRRAARAIRERGTTTPTKKIKKIKEQKKKKGGRQGGKKKREVDENGRDSGERARGGEEKLDAELIPADPRATRCTPALPFPSARTSPENSFYLGRGVRQWSNYFN